MDLISGTVVFEREVTVTTGGLDRAGMLRIVLGTQGDHSTCISFIPHVDEHDRKHYGDDQLQALCLCLKYVRMQIELAASQGVVIWWAEPGDNCLLG